MINALTSFWSTDRALSLLLVFLCCVIFVVVPLRELHVLGRFFLGASFSLLLVSGVLAVRRDVFTTVLVGTLVVASLAVRWTKLALGLPALEAWDALFSLVACAVLAAVVTVRVFRAGPITSQRIQGAIAVYLLLGLIWAFAYDLVEFMRPGAFLPAPGAAPERFCHFVYFSFIALTTVGFGDITPADPVARSLASLEALVGQLFPAILLARLVSMGAMYETAARHASAADEESRESATGERREDGRAAGAAQRERQ
ncbi:MAG: two pore domain potassium channel family protein [Deltaproteobacteria bacterium]|nr:two pore domain potassium channel family protein [Deltaproteobacteria bacterium]